ncbi:unnamed protein product, partial [Iphiclides podalirius]
MSFNSRKKKLMLFFEKIFEDDYEINVYYADSILKCLEGASICGLQNKLLDSSFFSDIILKTYNSPTMKRNSVEIFIWKVLSIIFKNELHFNKLNAMVRDDRLKLFMCTANACASNSDLVLAFTNVATASLVHYSGISWLVETKIWRPLSFERDGKRFEFQNQFILHLVVPLWTYYATNCDSDVKFDAINNYSFKLLNITVEHIAESAELFRTVVENHSCDLKKITIYTVKNLFQFKGKLNKAQAGVLYQGLFFVLKTFVISDDVDAHLILNENPLKTSDDIKLLILVLDAIKMLLKEHHIDWYENLEIICLHETLMNLLKQKCLCIKTLVQTLDLIDISIKKFLCPDMTLLIENKDESSLAEIGAITKEYIQHQEWEVRDSALILLLSCTQLSFVKYVPFQKMISENELMLLAAKCALHDQEVYVQTTALQCLAAATMIDRIWRDVTKTHPDLHDHLVNLARKHPEEPVRREAVNVLTEIYINQNVTIDYRNNMFRVMAGVVLKDLHWEVQIAALNFWKQAIVQQSLYRGMIDVVPNTTSAYRRPVLNLVMNP